MYRFYRKYYARGSNALMNIAVYLAIAAKLGLSIARNAVLRRLANTGGAPVEARAGIRRSET
jgi:hypothetical protein